jgi:hypothetical protein
MGRQIQICTTDADNLMVEEYLNSNFDCQFFQSSAPSIEEIFIQSFNQTSYPFSTQILIWNKVFSWEPEFSQDKTPKRNYYISNTSNAPLLEFSKTLWSRNEHGRLYWAKYFTSGTIEYDINEFERFYEIVTKWFIKNAKGKVKWAGVNIYYFEDAWMIHNEKVRKSI